MPVPQEEARDIEEHARPSEILTHAPWWMISVAGHAILLVLTLLAAWEEPRRELLQMTQIETLLEDPPPAEPEDPFDPDPVMEPEMAVDEAVDSPDAISSERSESQDDAESETDRGASLVAASDVDMASRFTKTPIGMAGGAAGDYGRRDDGGKANRRAREGGGGTEIPVELGLAWLARHQDPGGRWDSDDFQARCRANTCSGRGAAWCDVGLTGLALLAFLGAGYTQKDDGPFRDTVKRGLKYLVDAQDEDGCFGPRRGEYMYNHAIAALALAEAYGMTKGVILKNPAQRGIDFLAAAQNPGLGWRYIVRPCENGRAGEPTDDTSVTGWAVMAAKSAKVAELEVPLTLFDGARAWLDSVTDDTYCRTGYVHRGDLGARLRDQAAAFDTAETSTAISVMCRVFMGDASDKPLLRNQADLLSQKLPTWDTNGGPGGASKIDFYYWYYGTLAMFQIGRQHWKIWNAAMKPAIVAHQRHEGDELGSWDPVDAWGSQGGRVYATALNVLSLEVYYRYERAFR